MMIICLYIGWNSEVNKGFLCIYKLDFNPQNGTKVLLSLTIQENFSWMLSYRKSHVNQALCGILKNVPSQINTGTFFKSLDYTHIYLS